MNHETTHTGLDKITRYGWTVTDAPGRLEMVSKVSLIVDRDYQRDVSGHDAKVNRIAAEWSWVACGAIIVGLRDGKNHVIDGQHRVLAALKRSDIQYLPCVVFETQTQKEEAAGFIRANRNRKPMTAIQSFRAELMAGSACAKKAADMIDDAGLALSGHSAAGTFSAVGALKRAIDVDASAMDRAWPFLVEVFRDSSIHSYALRGCHYLERRLDGETLSDPFWIDKGVKVGRDAILKSMNAAAAYRGATGDAVWADGIMSALNRNQRTRSLKMKDTA